jgi:outer membrane protein OmpA-like peptidoglycan-associated protein
MNISGLRPGLFAGPIFIAAAIMTAGAGAAQAATCPEVFDAFDKAVKTRSVEAAKLALFAIDDEPVCSKHIEEFRAKYVDFLIDYAGAAGVPEADSKKALETAENTLLTSSNWQGKQKLGDYYFNHKDRPKAFYWYQKSADALATPGIKSTQKDREILLQRVAAAQSLSNNDHETQRGGGSFTPTTRGPTGSPSGVFANAFVRGVAAVKVPVPIQFEYREARFTAFGEQSMQELAEVVLKEQPKTMKLIGHADPRGPDQVNIDLSHRRVEAVRNELVRQGVKADIRIEWKGAHEPFDCSVLASGCNMSEDEKYQLDRRVEWVRDGVQE